MLWYATYNSFTWWKVARADKQEFGKAELELDDKDNILYKDIPNKTTVWMSHGDHVTEMAPNFKIIAHTDSSIAAIENKIRISMLSNITLKLLTLNMVLIC